MINGPFWFSLNQVKELPERLLEGRYRTLIDYQAKDPGAFSQDPRDLCLRFVEFPGAGHYLAEEWPDDHVRELTDFFK